jgi:M6 family metalloprotease-like protein
LKCLLKGHNMKMKTMIVNMVIFVALLLTIETAGGVPANPTPFTLTQPDNSSFQAIQVGDERGAHFETLDGYTVVKDESNWWNYAKKDEKGKLASTDQRVGLIEPERISLQTHLHPGVAAVELRPVEGQATINPVSALRILPSALAPQVGTKKALVILINFTDVSQNVSHTPSYYENLLFNASAGANSMNNYYKEVSYNKMNITGVIAGNRWFSASHNLAWYGADVTGTDEDTTQPDANNRYIFKLAKEAVIAADPYVDYSQYDTNGDGVIDNLIIVHAGNAQESSGVSTDIWSHRWSIYVWNGSWNLGYMTNDGVKAVGYTMQAETSPLGTFAHEFGHDLGLPDLYDTDYSSVGVGYWDIMGSGSWLNSGNTPAHLSAWSKYFLGWVNPTKVNTSLLNEQINQSESYDDVYMLLDNPGDSPGNLNWRSNGTGTGEYFLVENRRKTGYDAYLPGEGLLIWHIDESRGNNTNESRKLVDLEEADGLNHLDSNANSGDAFDPWYNSTVGFTETTTPNSNLYNGSASGARVTNISASASIMTANLILLNLASGAIVRINGSSALPLGSSVTSITLSEMNNFGSANIELHYNSSVVRVTSASLGFSGYGGSLTPNINNTIGKATFLITATDIPGPNSPLTLVNVNLQAVGSAGQTSPLNLSVVTLAFTNGTSATPTVNNGTFNIPGTLPPVIPGDVTGNGFVDAVDSMFLAQYVAGTRATLPNPVAGDVASPCSSIDAIDSMFVAQYVAGTRPSLQLCS